MKELAKIETLPERFSQTAADLAILAESTAHLATNGPEDREALKAVTQGRITLKNARLEIERTRKAEKEVALRYGQAVDKIARELKAVIGPEEDRLKGEEQRVADEIERRKREAYEKRAATLRDIPALWSPDAVEAMTDEEFEAFCDAERKRVEAEKEAERVEAARRKAEDEERAREAARIAEERAALEAERKAAAEERAKAEAAEAKARAAEQAAKRAEREAAEAAAREEAESKRREAEAARRAEEERQREERIREEERRVGERDAQAIYRMIAAAGEAGLESLTIKWVRAYAKGLAPEVSQ